MGNKLVEKLKGSIDREKTLSFNLKKLLKIFRDELPKRKDKRPHNYSKKEVMEVFIYLSNVDLSKLEARKRKKLAEMRAEYNVKKFTESWRKHISRKQCYICDRNGEVRHHIIGLDNGGSNSHNNIRTLCKKCHSEIHPWLKVKSTVTSI